MFYKKFILLLMYLVVTAIILSVIISNRLPTTKEYEINFDNLPKEFNGFTIIQLSDLHNAEFGKNNTFLIKTIKKHNPNIVVLTGDMIDSNNKNFTAFFTLAKALSNEFDTYFIIGNHEQALSENVYHYFIHSLKSFGITVLDNESVTLEHNNKQIKLYGMWFNLRYYSDRSNNTSNGEKYFFTKDIMSEILGEKPQNIFTILLTHNPLYFSAYSEWGADLTLSGHMHGGMIRLPFLGGVFSPDKTYFPTYDAGVFTNENHKIIISRGLGNGDMGFRLFNQPEIVKIKLKNEP